MKPLKKVPAKGKKANYDVDSIKVLGTMESLRAKMGMYLGGRGSEARFQTFKEVVDNVCDEFIQGRGDSVLILIDDKTGEITVSDTANGIPVGITKDTDTGTKMNTLTAVFTKTHAGGKFNSGAYDKGSKGTHGIGVTVTNAVSSYLKVWTCFKGVWYHQHFKLGKPQGEVAKSKPPKIDGKTPKLGTIVQFKLDDEAFTKGSKFPLETAHAYLDLLSYLHAGFKITVKHKGAVATYYQKEGLKSLLAKRLAEREGVEALGKPVFAQKDGVDFALQWSTDSDEQILSYVNGSKTIDGGTHVRGFLDAMNEAIKPYKGKRDFTPDDFRTGLILVLNAAVVEPEFTSQTKEKLATESVQKRVYEVVKPELEKFFASNKTFINQLLKRAEDMKKQRESFTANKKAIAALKSTKGQFALSSKFSSATTRDKDKVELFIVEGDSAGGTAKQARDREFQAVLKLKGKPINAYGPSGKKLFANAEAQDIMRAIGFEGDAKSLEKLKVGKIIILADPDVDGKHITVLVMSLLMRVMPKLYEMGKIYSVDAPLFIARTKNGIVRGNTLQEVQKLLGKEKPADGIKRLKGWGEANADELEELAMSPKTRKLIRVKAISGDEHRQFVALAGEDASAKKKLLGLVAHSDKVNNVVSLDEKRKTKTVKLEKSTKPKSKKTKAKKAA